jgi:hypothetical protein
VTHKDADEEYERDGEKNQGGPALFVQRTLQGLQSQSI